MRTLVLICQLFSMNNGSFFGERIRSERKRLGLTQDAAAQRVGVSKEMWGKYEREVAMPGGEVLLAAALNGFDVNYLLTSQSSGEGFSAISKRERELLDLYAEQGEHVKDAIDGLVRALSRKSSPGASATRHAPGQVFHGQVGQVIDASASSGAVSITTGHVSMGAGNLKRPKD
jgi:transcriptional regulator with XRE-family HTH domain